MRELAGQAEQSVLKWFGHIQRMEDQSMKRIVRSDVRDMRSRERSQMGWMDHLIRAMNERRMPV